MAKFYSELTEPLQEFIREQHLFFTATAPASGRINLSPKGINTFRCFDSKTVGYLDLTGSGNETSAHLLENGRMTIMFCSFTSDPIILRLYGQGHVIRPTNLIWNELSPLFELIPVTRQIIKLDIETVQTSCGFGVPVFEFISDRDKLITWATQKGEDGLHQYWHDKNQTSIDGLPTHLHQQTP
jgi:hypothetical protein